MRMRKKKNGEARVAACGDYLIKSPEETASYRERFPVELEIGCGKGNFICESAVARPDQLFLAVELSTDALIPALERAKREEIPNVRFLNINAVRLPEFLPERSVRVIYLNFSDPWPKARHGKRRLTYRTFLSLYRQLLTEDGKLCFKTDNRGLFDFSITEMTECGWRIENLTYDLHNSPFNEKNVQTEYEKLFSGKGMPIHRLEAYPPKTCESD